MSEEKQKFVVLHFVRYSFDTKKEADNFIQALRGHCDGFFVTLADDGTSVCDVTAELYKNGGLG